MFNNMKIGARLVLSFGLLIAFNIILILVGLFSMNMQHASLHRIVEVENVRNQLANTMINDVREVSINLRNVILTVDAKEQEGLNQTINDIRKDYDARFARYQELVPKDDKETEDQIARVKVTQDASREANNKVIALAMADKDAEAVAAMNIDAKPKVSQWVADVNQLIVLETQSSLRAFDAAENIYIAISTAMIIIGVVTLILAVLLAIILTRSLTRPLEVAVKLVTSRDLTMDLSDYIDGKNELAFMLRSFSTEIAAQKKAEAELTNILKEVQETTNVLSASSSEILAATTQVVSGSTETATAVSETTTTVEEVKQTSQLTSQKARYVSDNAEKAMQAAKAGRKAVEETVESVNHIREQIESIAESIVKLSEQGQAVGEIVATVTDIAEQVNLLSVNAAIEAARAGDQGKGFSVVAQEIKSLAEQSKQATSQVRTILNEVQKGISAAVMVTEQGSKAADAGVKQAAEAGQAIKVLTDSVTESAQAATQIAASSQQQTVGMDQVVDAMENIKKASAESLSSTKQVEISASDLNKLSQKLKDLVSKFKA